MWEEHGLVAIAGKSRLPTYPNGRLWEHPVGKLGIDSLAPVTWGLGFIKGRPGGPGGDSRPGPVLRPSHGLARVHVRAGARVSGVQFRILRASI